MKLSKLVTRLCAESNLAEALVDKGIAFEALEELAKQML